MKTISLIVYGTPVPQGSMRAFMRPGMKAPIVTADNKKTKPWKQEIAGCAAEAMQKAGLAVAVGVPIAVLCEFYFDRPKSLRKSIQRKVTRPDLDKCARAVLDALTGIVFKDDAQVTLLRVSKEFSDRPRAEIQIALAKDTA